MVARLNPYLSFRDTARTAMEFYETVFGGSLTMSTFADFHVSEDPAEQDKLMHSQLETTSGFTIMGSDTPNSMDWSPQSNMSVSLSGGADDEAELRGYWDKLVDGGTVALPLETAPWGDAFGMVIDKFGTRWMVNIMGSQG
ncbi:VOC family protein [Lacisediminihabitans changchengi]|uniref:VOC family protein n=1 Tax=Lacisediminihabitans changchengi TaxID=2787634 RepID=A0A934SJ92_9MICO|nr:VOC family protein [Lacisediminihabitans changchengi]MBK4347707.1 VOC family protein [Lacisediminihabitans changchengi]